ncbi:MAG: 4Fe-4S cluster-binding domain-containing protein [Asgard group archaeon]|nr:4Fe-4S cluster-binding domain-containing protein [Asgard group archaeon]
MPKKIRKLAGKSLVKGSLPEGCVLCRKGAKLFFFTSGICCENCFYCSLADIRRGKEVTFANERPVKHFSSVMLEVTNMNALGAAITGGDPLATFDITEEYIKKMKKQFGDKFHIHLYTSGRFASKENLERLFIAGLDEIRFHPQNKEQKERISQALDFEWDVGAEIPVLPDKKKETIQFLDYLESLDGVKFCNLNELEITESNLRALQKKGYEIKEENPSAIAGSEDLAKRILKTTDYSYTLHFCSAYSKDAVQFRNRLKRTATNVKKPYEEIRDGMLVKAVIIPSEYIIAEELLDILIDEYEVDNELIEVSEENNLLTAWYIADSLQEVLFERFEVKNIEITVEYPTYGRTLIAKSSLRDFQEDLDKK